MINVSSSAASKITELLAEEQKLNSGLREARRRVDARKPRGKLRSTAQAGSKAFDFRRGRAAKEATVLAPRQADVAHGPTIDPRRANADEKAAVEAGVMRGECAVAAIGIEHHATNYARFRRRHSPFSDMCA